MKFKETELNGAFVIEPEKKEDSRGFFARSYCEKEFKENGIPFTPVQANISYNKNKRTLRGMHYQVSPYEEAKLVRCSKGGIYDVIIDLRPSSPAFEKWIGIELTDENYRMLYVPKGFAHGFITLKDFTEVTYLMSDFYVPGKDAGIKWDDPYYKIDWPEAPAVISGKDRSWPMADKM